MARLVAKLRHDVLELRVDHGFRHDEVVATGQLVKQLALHVGTRQAVQFLRLLVADQALQLVEVLQAERLCELLVDGARRFGPDRFHGCGEGRILALELLRRIVRGEGDVEFPRLADLGADELVLEARDQLAGAELDRHVLALAPLERLAADLAFEIDDDEVAVCGRVPLLGVGPVLRRTGELLELLVHRGLVDFDGQAIELEIVDVGGRDLGKRFEADGDLGVLARLVALVEFDLRLQRRTDVLLAEQLLHAVLDRALQSLAAQAFAVHLADQVRRHLAGAEARHPHLRRDALHFGLDPRLDVGGRDGQHEGALEALALGFDGLDGHVAKVLMKNSFLGRIAALARGFPCSAVPRTACARKWSREGTRTPTSCDTGT